MSRPTTMALAGIAAVLSGCSAASVAVESSTPTATAITGPVEEVCVGRNAQNLDVPSPASEFGRAWNETGDEARLALLSEAWAEHGTHLQPDFVARLTGRTEMDAHIEAFQTNRPGEYFEWRGWEPWYLHHDRVFMPWRLCSADGTVLLEGFDVGIIDAEGRLVDNTGFSPSE
jgi:hypothetical protein